MALGQTGTRKYDYADGQRVSVAAASAQSSAIDALEVLLHASVKCYVNVGTNPTAVATGASIPLEAGEKFHLVLNARFDKVAVIRDSIDGYLHIIPVL